MRRSSRRRAADKRDRLIDELLDSQAWVDYWTYWYGDLLRVTHNRIGNAAMKHFDAWLRQSFRDDKPYDRLVTELLTASAPNTNWMPDAAPATFLARWYVAGATMYTDQYEDTADEIFVQSARLFLGINYQCVSCHNGRSHLEKVDLDLTAQNRRDFWSMAAFFGGTRVRAVRYQDRFIVTDDGTGYDTKAASTVRLQRAGPDGAADVHPDRGAGRPDQAAAAAVCADADEPSAVRARDGQPDLEAVLRPRHRRTGGRLRHGAAGSGASAAGAVDACSRRIPRCSTRSRAISPSTASA